MNTLVRRASSEDIDAVSSIHREAFSRQRDSERWVTATMAAAPRMLAYVVVIDEGVAGYIFWAQKSGIRPAAVIELDQIAVLSRFRGCGLGEQLIRHSLELVEAELAANGQSVRSVLV